MTGSEDSYPAYLKLYRSGKLARLAEEAVARLASCGICPRECGVNRLDGEKGTCGIGRWAVVASYNLHFGEERVLVGRGGSGTIFFSGCNLKCTFCQNYEISQYVEGTAMNAGELAACMLELQETGCHNLNLVTPTHVVPQILEALVIAVEQGFSLPIVYNTGGYDSIEIIKMLDGVVDIYMPDIKYLDEGNAERLSNAGDYPSIVREVLREMYRQVGDLLVSDEGIAVRGLLVRHLVLPGMLDDTKNVIKFIADEISPQTYTNIMNQYHPCYKAYLYPPIDRPLEMDDWMEAVRFAKEAGLRRLYRS